MNLTNLQQLLALLTVHDVNPVGTLLTADPNGELKLSFTQNISLALHGALMQQSWVFQNSNSYNYRPE